MSSFLPGSSPGYHIAFSWNDFLLTNTNTWSQEMCYILRCSAWWFTIRHRLTHLEEILTICKQGIKPWTTSLQGEQPAAKIQFLYVIFWQCSPERNPWTHAHKLELACLTQLRLSCTILWTGLQQRTFIVSQSWRLCVPDEGTSQVGSY